MGKTAEDLKNDLEQQRESLGRDLVAIGYRVSPGRMVERRKHAVRQSVGRARNAVMGVKDSTAGHTSDALSNAVSSVGDTASSVGSAVSGAPHAISVQTQGNPFAAGLIAFGVGALAGSLLPTTRREEQAVAQVQPALESAAEELSQGAQAVAESAKEHATEAVQHLKGQAQDAAESVKADALDAAESVKTEAHLAAPPTEHASPGADWPKRA